MFDESHLRDYGSDQIWSLFKINSSRTNFKLEKLFPCQEQETNRILIRDHFFLDKPIQNAICKRGHSFALVQIMTMRL